MKNEDKLEEAIINYIDGLPLDSLVEWVSNDLTQYYLKKANAVELKEFIDAYYTDSE